MKERVCILILNPESRVLVRSRHQQRYRRSLRSCRPNRYISVGSVVSRVKGQHHDGGALRWTVSCRQFRWYREPIRPVWMNGFFVLWEKQDCPFSHVYVPQQKPSKSKHLPKGKKFLRRSFNYVQQST